MELGVSGVSGVSLSPPIFGLDWKKNFPNYLIELQSILPHTASNIKTFRRACNICSIGILQESLSLKYEHMFESTFESTFETLQILLDTLFSNTVFPRIVSAEIILFRRLKCGNYSREETINLFFFVSLHYFQFCSFHNK